MRLKHIKILKEKENYRKSQVIMVVSEFVISGAFVVLSITHGSRCVLVRTPKERLEIT